MPIITAGPATQPADEKLPDILYSADTIVGGVGPDGYERLARFCYRGTCPDDGDGNDIAISAAWVQLSAQLRRWDCQAAIEVGEETSTNPRGIVTYALRGVLVRFT